MDIFRLCEKCPNKDFFLVRIFPHSDWVRRDTEYLSVFSRNTEKYGPEKSPYLDTFHVVSAMRLRIVRSQKVSFRHIVLIHSYDKIAV